jgi:hypothetical protein
MFNAATFTRAMGLAILVTLLGACASGPPKPTVDYKPDYDFGKVVHIAFYHDSGQVMGDNPLQLSDIQRDRINKALVYALEDDGYRFIDDPAQADLLLSWHLVTQERTDVRTYETPAAGYGAYYGRYNRYSGYRCWDCTPMRTEVSVRNYTQGTFIVDMIDPTLKKSVWRGVTQSRMKSEPSQDQAHYNEAARVIFESFPPY